MLARRRSVGQFATTTANTRIGGSPLAWDGSFDDKNHQSAAKTGEPTALAPLRGDTVSFAFTNNEMGQVVGFSGLCSNVTLPPFIPPNAPHAVLWDANGNPRDLGNPPGGAGDNVAVGINNHGQITVNSVMSDGTSHAFLWSGELQDLGTYPADAFVTVAPCCSKCQRRRTDCLNV